LIGYPDRSLLPHPTEAFSAACGPPAGGMGQPLSLPIIGSPVPGSNRCLRAEIMRAPPIERPPWSFFFQHLDKAATVLLQELLVPRAHEFLVLLAVGYSSFSSFLECFLSAGVFWHIHVRKFAFIILVPSGGGSILEEIAPTVRFSGIPVPRGA